jgi:hypothetical protein
LPDQVVQDGCVVDERVQLAAGKTQKKKKKKRECSYFDHKNKNIITLSRLVLDTWERAQFFD